MTDANAEMLEQIERYPRIRDRAFFLGSPDTLPDATFGVELPAIREWVSERFTFTGTETLGVASVVARSLRELL